MEVDDLLRFCWQVSPCRGGLWNRSAGAVGESKADTAMDATTLAAWTMLANELMNLDEVLNK